MANIAIDSYLRANYSILWSRMKTKSKLLLAFGDTVRDLRNTEGISQEELAEKASLHRTYIGMIERAEKNLTIENINKITKALNISLSNFFTLVDRKYGSK